MSALTGKAYRLPTLKEARTIYPEPSKDENTLDYWAGYSLNPDDARRVLEKVGELKGFAPLLKEGGQFVPRGENPVYDLGGNAAEWVESEDGNGVAYGGSADRPGDPKGVPVEPSIEYTGFRVLLVPEHTVSQKDEGS